MFPGQRPKHIYLSLPPPPPFKKYFIAFFIYLMCVCRIRGRPSGVVSSPHCVEHGDHTGVVRFCAGPGEETPPQGQLPSFPLSSSDQNLGVEACKTERGQSSRVPYGQQGFFKVFPEQRTTNRGAPQETEAIRKLTAKCGQDEE